MAEDNFQRMIHLAEEFFGAKRDPAQITVTPEDLEKLRLIHPATLAEKRDDNGPVAWAIVIPTTLDLMNPFIAGKITEKNLLEQTPLREKYAAVYLCSVLVLPEYRGRGLAKSLVVEAIESIRHEHPIQSLFFWAFSVAGKELAQSIAQEFRLPLFKRSV